MSVAPISLLSYNYCFVPLGASIFMSPGNRLDSPALSLPNSLLLAVTLIQQMAPVLLLLLAQFFKRNPRILLASVLSPRTHMRFITKLCHLNLLNASHSAPSLLSPYTPGPCLPTSSYILFPFILHRVDRMMVDNVSLIVWLLWPFSGFPGILSSSSKSLFDTTCKTLCSLGPACAWVITGHYLNLPGQELLHVL